MMIIMISYFSEYINIYYILNICYYFFQFSAPAPAQLSQDPIPSDQESSEEELEEEGASIPSATPHPSTSNTPVPDTSAPATTAGHSEAGSCFFVVEPLGDSN